MDQFQMRSEAFKFGRRQSGKEVILIGLMGWGTNIPLALVSEVWAVWARSGVETNDVTAIGFFSILAPSARLPYFQLIIVFK